MEKKNNDLRFVRTRSSIFQAMISLLQEKSFDKITVKDICSRANISRSGFYLHYVDKYDFVESYQKELMKKGTAIFENNIGKSRKIFMEDAVRFLQEEGQILALLLSKNGSPEIQDKIKVLLQDNAKKNILPHIEIPIKTKLAEKYLVVFMSSAVVGVLQEWVNSGQKEAPEEIIELLARILSINII
ncbi:hypothetical protein UCO_02818 [Enterococcus faecalis EnGen0244]|uniref:TetR/AcrR family transcriptional regulator n=1 Tax=Enterococcus faecalis TaxID=1351 RepID=UPI000330953F|nr:TetR/AcrR family transcriptional regulator [Enterococcus faecalis]EOI09970.1 hypothetical protein UCO_02818 [Enterococcus faecalis EnGen0244]